MKPMKAVSRAMKVPLAAGMMLLGVAATAGPAHALAGGGGISVRPGLDLRSGEEKQQIDTAGFSLAIGGRGWVQPSPMVRVGGEGYKGWTRTGDLVWGGILGELVAPVGGRFSLGFGSVVGAWGASLEGTGRGLEQGGIYVEPGISAALNMGAVALETRASYMIPFALKVEMEEAGIDVATRPRFGYGAVTVSLLFGDFWTD